MSPSHPGPAHLHQQLAAHALDAGSVHVALSHQDLDLLMAQVMRQQHVSARIAGCGHAPWGYQLSARQLGAMPANVLAPSALVNSRHPALTGERQWMPARLRTAISRPIISLQERS